MVTESQKDSLEFVREIRAKPERVFRTFTTPENLMEWWGKRGWPMTLVQIDLKLGGRYRLDFRNPADG